jgi:hypothetical protein
MNTRNPTPSAQLSVHELEQAYDALATAIDKAGPDKATLFLVKLALLNANALANPELMERHIDVALLDL